ncbi:MAG: alpha/beta hydrolase [Chlamydiales bacterium]|nr:alpha/beta hydrolase [Chlamydiales bacterium]
MMATQRTVDIRGEKIWTEALGDPANAPVLLISGAGAHAHFWTDTFCRPLLSAGFYLIRYDHRDTGLSHPSKSDYELQDLVEDAVGILNGYNIRDAHIVGHSMGGYIGQLMAASHPDRMRSLVIISAGPVGETGALTAPYTPEEKEVMHKTWLVMLRNRPTDDFEGSYEGFRGVWERLNGSIPVEEGLARNYTQEMFTRSRYPVGAHARHMHVMRRIAETLKERRETFSNITLPTLIIHGEEDYLVPIQRGGRALAEKIPQAECAFIPKMGHMLFDYSIEERVSERIASFLSSSA